MKKEVQTAKEKQGRSIQGVYIFLFYFMTTIYQIFYYYIF